MIYVQHLLGVGHFQRALQLAAALEKQGFAVDLVSGGMPLKTNHPPSVTLHQLPPARSADASFSRLLDAGGNDIDDAWREARRRQLLELFDTLSPQVLITETFPFGRRMMRFELLPLLQNARENSRCVQIISSIRDILQPKSKPGRNREICDLVEQYYDHVLVHGDSSIADLGASFADAAKIRDKVFYSGYICQHGAAMTACADGVDQVLVSAGGSDTGLRILETAIASKPLSSLKQNKWRILVSPTIDETALRKLQRLADKDTYVERNRPDFASLMQAARLSISQAGYNTVTDIVSSRTPAVVIPFADAGEIEQTLRARQLQDKGRLIMLDAQELTAANLATAIDQALELDTSMSLNLDGAYNSAARIAAWLEEAQA